MHSINKVDENIEKIGKLFPNCITERKNEKGEVEYAVDFDMLKQELSTVVVEGNEERYQFTWPDKKKSILLANAPIAKTLRPCREESVDFDNTENLYIEGDNLDVLKLLQETYLGKIKMIYIDPPYNTGNDFVYNDDFAESAEEYLANSGQFDDEGNRLVTNTESNGRYHTDWLNMIYSRLKLAKDLLSDDGLIFIHIDDNEVENLKKVCDEIFGEINFVNCIAVKMSEPTGVKMAHTSKKLPKLKEYVLVYKKLDIDLENIRIPKEKWDSEYKLVLNNISREDITKVKEIMNNEDATQHEIECADELLKNMTVGSLDSLFKEFKATTEDEKTRTLYDNAWRIARDVATTGGAKTIADKKKMTCFGNFFLIKTPQNKKYLIKSDYNDNSSQPRIKILFADDYLTVNPCDFWADIKTTGLENEGYVEFLNGKKPLALLQRILQLHKDKNCMVMDFFSGSGSTAEAVLRQNILDNGNRKFIMVQIPESCDEKSSAYESGFKTICEIGKERIRRAGAKIKEESPMTTADLDTGFRVLKLDSSNMKDVYYNPADYERTLFDELSDNIKEDRTPEDLLFQVMLDLGVLLSSKIEESTIGGKKVFNVADGFLYACFDDNVTEDVITQIAKKRPYYFVMRDSSMANDSVATNFEQIFATYSPETVRKVL